MVRVFPETTDEGRILQVPVALTMGFVGTHPLPPLRMAKARRFGGGFHPNNSKYRDYDMFTC